MKQLLDQIAETIKASAGCNAVVTATPIAKPNAPWVRLTLSLASADGLFVRPLIAVLAPPSRWPVVVDYYHIDPRRTTGYRFEWGRDPNAVHADNPPTIDNEAELQKVLDGLMALPETAVTIRQLS